MGWLRLRRYQLCGSDDEGARGGDDDISGDGGEGSHFHDAFDLREMSATPDRGEDRSLGQCCGEEISVLGDLAEQRRMRSILDRSQRHTLLGIRSDCLRKPFRKGRVNRLHETSLEWIVHIHLA